jgi:hypothetical protein
MSAPIAFLFALALAAGGIYVLTHVSKTARALQNVYVKAAEQKQERGGWSAYLYMYNPEYWKRPFAWFIFKSGMIFLGIWLLIVAFSVAVSPFAPLHLGGTVYLY